MGIIWISNFLSRLSMPHTWLWHFWYKRFTHQLSLLGSVALIFWHFFILVHDSKANNTQAGTTVTDHSLFSSCRNLQTKIFAISFLHWNSELLEKLNLTLWIILHHIFHHYSCAICYLSLPKPLHCALNKISSFKLRMTASQCTAHFMVSQENFFKGTQTPLFYKMRFLMRL